MGLFTKMVNTIAKQTGLTQGPSSDEREVLNQHAIDEGFGGTSFFLDTARNSVVKDSSEWLEQFNENPRLSGLNKIVSDNGVTPFNINYYGDKGKQKVTGHPLEEELKTATVPMFFSLWTAYRYMTGIVYIAYDTGKEGPENFKVFTETHLVSRGASGETYVFQEGDKKTVYHKDNVIIDYDLDLNDPYNNGFGKAAAIMKEIEADELVLNYLTNFYVNSARPDAFIVPKTSKEGTLPSPEDLQRLASNLRDFHKGWRNSHKMAVLGFEATIETIPTNHRDMELLETRKMYRDTSHQHFGIPPEIMGIIENSNKATVVAAEHIYAKQVRMPLLHHFEDIINSKILPKYKNSEYMEFEFDNILPDDDELNMEKAEIGYKAGSLTVNEHRELLGFKRLKNDYGNMPVGTEYNVEEHGELEEVSDVDYGVDVIPYEKAVRKTRERITGVPLGSILQLKEENGE